MHTTKTYYEKYNIHKARNYNAQKGRAENSILVHPLNNTIHVTTRIACLYFVLHLTCHSAAYSRSSKFLIKLTFFNWCTDAADA